jgi:excisionase family DNA binding protein
VPPMRAACMPKLSWARAGVRCAGGVVHRLHRTPSTTRVRADATMLIMTAELDPVRKYVSLPEAAAVLGVHRATVNDMVLSRRLRARMRRGRWYVDQTDLEAFAATYERPSNAPPRRPDNLSPGGKEVLELIREFGEATVSELNEIVQLHEGNIRKQLRILMARGLVERSDDGRWTPCPPSAPPCSEPVGSSTGR